MPNTPRQILEDVYGEHLFNETKDALEQLSALQKAIDEGKLIPAERMEEIRKIMEKITYDLTPKEVSPRDRKTIVMLLDEFEKSILNHIKGEKK